MLEAARQTLLASMCALLAGHASAVEFNIKEYKRYGGESIELYTVKSGGASFAAILDLIEPHDESFPVGILSPVTNETETEILDYYRKHQPRALNRALKSFTGELYNGGLEGLKKSFNQAFESTSLFHDLRNELKQRGYDITRTTYQEFTFYNGKPWVGEIMLHCKRSN